MKINCLSTGSLGNCYIIDNGVDSIILECGLDFEKIIVNVNIDKLKGCLISHSHQDHSKSRKDFEKWNIPCYSTDNIKPNKLLKIGTFNVLAIKAYHNIDCYSFWIRDKINNKDILFATDTIQLPQNISDTYFDTMLLECHHDIDIIQERLKLKLPIEGMWSNHCSLQAVENWLKNKAKTTNNLLLIHKSNHNLLNEKTAKERLEIYANNVTVVNNNTIYNF